MIIKEPTEMIPVKDTEVMRFLLTQELRDYIEGQVEVKIADGNRWAFYVNMLKQAYLRKSNTKFINMEADPDNRLKYLFYRA